MVPFKGRPSNLRKLREDTLQLSAEARRRPRPRDRFHDTGQPLKQLHDVNAADLGGRAAPLAHVGEVHDALLEASGVLPQGFHGVLLRARNTHGDERRWAFCPRSGTVAR